MNKGRKDSIQLPYRAISMTHERRNDSIQPVWYGIEPRSAPQAPLTSSILCSESTPSSALSHIFSLVPSQIPTFTLTRMNGYSYSIHVHFYSFLPLPSLKQALTLM